MPATLPAPILHGVARPRGNLVTPCGAPRRQAAAGHWGRQYRGRGWSLPGAAGRLRRAALACKVALYFLYSGCSAPPAAPARAHGRVEGLYGGVAAGRGGRVSPSALWGTVGRQPKPRLVAP